MSILVCSTKYDGCGYVGESTEWGDWGPEYEDVLVCPICRDDHAFQITRENIESLTDSANVSKAQNMLEEEEKFAAERRAAKV